MHEPYLTSEWLHTCAKRFIFAPWLIHMCAMTHSYVRPDSMYVRHDSFMCVPWLNRDRCTTTMFWVQTTFPFIHLPWLIYTHDTTHSYVRHDSFVWAPWLIHTCAMTPLWQVYDHDVLSANDFLGFGKTRCHLFFRWKNCLSILPSFSLSNSLALNIRVQFFVCSSCIARMRIVYSYVRHSYVKHDTFW